MSENSKTPKSTSDKVYFLVRRVKALPMVENLNLFLFQIIEIFHGFPASGRLLRFTEQDTQTNQFGYLNISSVVEDQ